MKPRNTQVAISGDSFLINGAPTHKNRQWQGKKIEGLLLNARTVQGIFDDLNPATRERWNYPDGSPWDPERNTAEFVSAMPEWRRHGLLAFTVNLQGGMPIRGAEVEQPWHNSALAGDGSLRPEYMRRLEKILDRADELGMAAILGIFYFGQDERLKDEDAVVRGVENAVNWVLEKEYRNVLVEINNECNIHYEHAILNPPRVHELIRLAKGMVKKPRRLYVSTSYGGNAIPGENVVRNADFLLLHGNGVENPARIAEMVLETRQVPGYRPVPILFNEDDHYGFENPECNLTAAVGEYASWGYYDQGKNNYLDGFQSPPTNWGISSGRKKAFFEKVREITGS